MMSIIDHEGFLRDSLQNRVAKLAIDVRSLNKSERMRPGRFGRFLFFFFLFTRSGRRFQRRGDVTLRSRGGVYFLLWREFGRNGGNGQGRRSSGKGNRIWIQSVDKFVS